MVEQERAEEVDLKSRPRHETWSGGGLGQGLGRGQGLQGGGFEYGLGGQSRERSLDREEGTAESMGSKVGGERAVMAVDGGEGDVMAGVFWGRWRRGTRDTWDEENEGRG
jgi:hypothetical protein